MLKERIKKLKKLTEDFMQTSVNADHYHLVKVDISGATDGVGKTVKTVSVNGKEVKYHEHPIIDFQVKDAGGHSHSLEDYEEE